MANGYHGQHIMVFPDLDVVAVTTGRDWCPLHEFADLVCGSVKSDKSLPADAPSANLLANRILNVSTEKPTPVGPAPKLAGIISGKVYRFSPNQVYLRSLSLMLTDPQPRYDMEIYDARDTTKSVPRFAGPIGLDGLYLKGEPTYVQWLGLRRVNALKRTWLDDHTFAIDRLMLGLGSIAD
jgi:hypothetical protein